MEEKKEWRDWYHVPQATFYRPLPDGHYLEMSAKEINLCLKQLGLRGSVDKDEAKAGVKISEVDAARLWIIENNTVDYVGPLAGYRPGCYKMRGRKVLVTHSAAPPELRELTANWREEEMQVAREFLAECKASAKETEHLMACLDAAIERVDADHDEPGAGWPLLSIFLRGLLLDKTVDQRDFVHGWIRNTVAAMVRGMSDKVSPPHAPFLVLAGVQGCGKTLFKELVCYMFGGREAYPYAYMTGETDKNGDLIGSVLQVIDDQSSETGIKDRHKLSQSLKNMTVGGAQRIRAMFSDGVELVPLWRVLFLCNVDPDSLRVLPPLDMVRDKGVILKGVRPLQGGADGEDEENFEPMPIPTDSENGRALFQVLLRHEIATYLHWLLNVYQLPKDIGPTDRFPVKAWQHPDIVGMATEEAPWKAFWDLLERSILVAGEWRGSAQDLVECIRAFEADKSKDRVFSYDDVNKTYSKSRVVGRHLQNMVKFIPKHCQYVRVGHESSKTYVLKR